jgi:pimeloyl-ACP methyl ester carboxylesterase
MAGPIIERFTVPSSDGVPISVQKAGSGTALLLVHGALLNGTLTWGAVLPKLAERFTVYAMDRRGRAPSGDAKPYSLETEADDIVHVVRAIGSPLRLLGHSYGALASMAAENRFTGVERLILYEPPLRIKPLGPRGEEVVARMQAAVDAGDRAQVVTMFFRDKIGVPAEQLARIEASPIWPIVLEISSTLPRESREVNTYRSWQERLARWKTPVTMMLGTGSSPLLKEATAYVSQSIPGCRVVMLEGQGHGAMLDAPELFIAKLIEIAVPEAGRQTAW